MQEPNVILEHTSNHIPVLNIYGTFKSSLMQLIFKCLIWNPVLSAPALLAAAVTSESLVKQSDDD